MDMTSPEYGKINQATRRQANKDSLDATSYQDTHNLIDIYMTLQYT